MDYRRSTVGLRPIMNPHRTVSENIFNFDHLDNPRYEVFRDSSGNRQAKDNGSAFGSTRNAASANMIVDFLDRFYCRIGMW